jgi:MOSC domain-containing protein
VIDLTVVSAGYAPVKGTAHRPYDVVELTPTGVVGDRGLCLVDVEQRRVLRTIQNPGLLTVLARRDGDLLEVTVPGAAPLTAPIEPTAETLTCEYWGRPVELRVLAGPHAELLGDHLGRRVTLTAAPPAAVVFNGPTVTVIGTASLRDLGERTGLDLVAEAARFRATLIVETDEPHIEETWLGRDLKAGDATLRGAVPIPRCAIIDHSPLTAEKDARLLKTLAGYRPLNKAGEPVFGTYAQVTGAGRAGRTS